jgi:hypothetical protein
MTMKDEKNTIFRYLPAANVTVGKVLLIKGRGEGIVRGILTASYTYLTREGNRAHVNDIFRVCLWFDDGKVGASLNPFRPTDFLLLPGWGTYMPRGTKESPWQELR